MSPITRYALGQWLWFIYAVGGFWALVLGFFVWAHLKTGGPHNPKHYTPRWLRKQQSRLDSRR
jgi:hypothetical protein